MSSNPAGPTAMPGDHQISPADSARLKAGAVGLVGVLLMAVANAAPITAMSFNVPIAIDGMVIRPGDLVLGDADGLLCVPFEDAEALLAATHKKMELEKQMMADIAAGRLDTAWIDVALKKIGCNTEPR